jgi:GMP synthase-like glutamine amidotransferase
MYVYVTITEREDYYRDGPNPTRSRVKARLEEISGERCLIVPFEEFDLKAFNELKPRAIAVSGYAKALESFRKESFHPLAEVLHKADVPIIGLCGGHQLFAYFFHERFAEMTRLEDQPIRKLDPLEDTPRQVSYHPEYFYANGVFPVFRLKEDPIFAGMPEVMYMQCWHYCEVKEVPAEFEVIAETKHCKVEAMRHRTRPIYGVQFHPEAYEAPFLDGRTLLANFARITKEFWESRKEG